jgi:HEAT repeat protein
MNSRTISTGLLAALGLVLLAGKTWAQAEPLKPDEATRQSLHAVRTVQLQVTQDYGEAEGVTLPLRRLATDMLKLANWETAAETAAADATLEITARGTPEAARYEMPDKDITGEHYSGANLEGTIILSVSGKTVVEQTFSGRVKNPFLINRSYRRPQDAPFAGTLPGFCEGVFLALAAVHGQDPLLAGTKSATAEIQLGALKALIDAGDAQAVPALAPTLKDASEAVRAAAAQALGAIGDGAALPALIEALQENEAKARDRFLGQFHEIELHRLVEVDYGLHPCETDDDRREWARSIESLSDFDTRHAILWAAYHVKAPDKQAQLAAALRDEGSVMRRVGAANLIGQLEDKQGAGPLREALRDRWFLVRAAAAVALGHIGDPLSAEPLLAAANDPNAFVRSCAASSLSQVGATRWEEFLAAAGVHKSKEGEDAPVTVEILLRAMQEADPLIRAQAVENIKNIKPPLEMNPRVLDRLTGLMRDPSIHVRSAAAYELSGVPDARPVPAMLVALADPDSSVHFHAARYFEEVPDKRATAGLTALLKSEDGETREAAARALGKSRDPQAVEPLSALAGDGHSLVQEAVAEALGELGGGRARVTLEKMRDSGMTPAVQIAAAEALEKLGTKQDALALLAELRRVRPRLRESVATALGRSGDVRVIDPLIALLPEKEDGDHTAEGEQDREKIIGLSLEEAARQALEGLTGESHYTAAEWRRWWSANRATFVPKKD